MDDLEPSSTRISIHALLAESDRSKPAKQAKAFISIHALLAESDNLTERLHWQVGHFYPRSPCGERLIHPLTEPKGQHISIHALLAESDAKKTSIAGRITLFLSTLSLRRATTSHCGNDGRPVHFYPRSPCGERPDGLLFIDGRNGISIHALLAESDAGLIFFLCGVSLFLSTLSLRRATTA